MANVSVENKLHCKIRYLNLTIKIKMKLQSVLITLILPTLLALTGCEANNPVQETAAEPVVETQGKAIEPTVVTPAATPSANPGQLPGQGLTHCDKHAHADHDCVKHCAKHKGKKGKACLEHCHHQALAEHNCEEHCAKHPGGKDKICQEHCANHENAEQIQHCQNHETSDDTQSGNTHCIHHKHHKGHDCSDMKQCKHHDGEASECCKEKQ